MLIKFIFCRQCCISPHLFIIRKFKNKEVQQLYFSQIYFLFICLNNSSTNTTRIKLISKQFSKMSNSNDCLSQLLVIEELIAAEDWTSTEIVCTEAIAEDAHNAKFFSNRGIARTNLHRHNEALEDFDLAISIDPINRTAILGRARALLNTRHVDDAEDVVTSVLEDDIGDREAHKLLKDVAVVKFRELFTKGFASGQRTQLSLLQMSDCISNEKLNAEEMRLVRLELKRMWCDCIENPGIVPLFIKLMINLGNVL